MFEVVRNLEKIISNFRETLDNFGPVVEKDCKIFGKY